jgi:hypothetical protein
MTFFPVDILLSNDGAALFEAPPPQIKRIDEFREVVDISVHIVGNPNDF